MTKTKRKVGVHCALLLTSLMAGVSLEATAARARDFLLAATRPARLHLVDLEKREVVKSIDIATEPGSGPLAVVGSPDGKRAYVTVDRWESVSGIDLDSGKEVFRANLSTLAERVKNTFALEISRDGKELFVFEAPVRLGLSEYQVQDTRIAVYDTSSGQKAQPVRTFKAPRQIAMLMMSPDGEHLYGVGRDIYDFNPKTGEIVKTIKVQNRTRTDIGAPDTLAIWPQYEQANVFANPYVVEDKSTGVLRSGQMVFDLATQSLTYGEFEEFKDILFSSVINPKKRNESFTVYTTLSKIDTSGPETKLVKRVDLPHTYYTVNISGDGKELYVGGTQGDIAVYSSTDLKQLGDIKLPGAGDQQLASVRIIQR